MLKFQQSYAFLAKFLEESSEIYLYLPEYVIPLIVRMFHTIYFNSITKQQDLDFWFVSVT